MTSIWGFLLQTCEVSIVALLLLFIKRVFKDKLPPKWQYGVWILLLINIFIPVGIFGNYLFPTISIIVEMIKGIVEKMMSSNYIQTYETITNISVFPMIKDKPSSITDILFILYIIGILICLLRYVFQYIQIKRILRHGINDEMMTQKVCDIANQYDLKSCKVILLKDVPTAFVFGIIHPILILPNSDVDEKIILHELLHVKYYDCLQSVIWSILSCLHWCNPFMNYIFKEIKNDMESLCDQRVLEIIDGEDRRDYGRILLNMCNDSYAYTFGTTSISNGTKHIKTRIESIVRFKKYPKGMALVSLCIIILLAPLSLGGNDKMFFISTKAFNGEFNKAAARMVKCETVAGAIDTFVKGLNDMNEYYIMSVTKSEKRNDFENYYRKLPFQSAIEDERYSQNIIHHLKEVQDYYILNLYEENDVYEGILVLKRVGAFDTGEMADIFDYIPIRIFDENGYKVEITGEIYAKGYIKNDFYHSMELMDEPYKIATKKIDSGEFTIKLSKLVTVKQQENENTNMFWNTDTQRLYYLPNPYAEFETIRLEGEVSYISTLEDVNHIGFVIIPGAGEFEDFSSTTYQGNVSGSGSDGMSFRFMPVDDSWNHEVTHLFSDNRSDIQEERNVYRVRIYKNHEIAEEFTIEVELWNK